MKHNYRIILILIPILGLLGFSCAQEDVDIDLTANPWKVVKIKKSGQVNFTNTDSTYILQFLSDSEYELSLDVNTCTGQYHNPNKGDIEIQAMACTEICCDTEFAGDLSLLFSKMKRYYARGNELHFEGGGRIVLQNY